MQQRQYLEYALAIPLRYGPRTNMGFSDELLASWGHHEVESKVCPIQADGANTEAQNEGSDTSHFTLFPHPITLMRATNQTLSGREMRCTTSRRSKRLWPQ